MRGSTERGLGVLILLYVFIFIHSKDHENSLLYNAVIMETVGRLLIDKEPMCGYILRIHTHTHTHRYIYIFIERDI